MCKPLVDPKFPIQTTSWLMCCAGCAAGMSCLLGMLAVPQEAIVGVLPLARPLLPPLMHAGCCCAQRAHSLEVLPSAAASRELRGVLQRGEAAKRRLVDLHRGMLVKMASQFLSQASPACAQLALAAHLLHLPATPGRLSNVTRGQGPCRSNGEASVRRGVEDRGPDPLGLLSPLA